MLRRLHALAVLRLAPASVQTEDAILLQTSGITYDIEPNSQFDAHGRHRTDDLSWPIGINPVPNSIIGNGQWEVQAASWCIDGLNGTRGVCCAKECGECGGPSCSAKRPGKALCCNHAIRKENRICTDPLDVGCMLPEQTGLGMKTLGRCSALISRPECDAIAAEIGAPGGKSHSGPFGVPVPLGCFMDYDLQHPNDSPKVYYSYDEHGECSENKRCFCAMQERALVPRSTLSGWCASGINGSFGVCCPRECGLCGGHKCSQRPGGNNRCCNDRIRQHNRRCETPLDTACLLPPEALGVDYRTSGFCKMQLTFEECDLMASVIHAPDRVAIPTMCPEHDCVPGGCHQFFGSDDNPRDTEKKHRVYWGYNKQGECSETRRCLCKVEGNTLLDNVEELQALDS